MKKYYESPSAEIEAFAVCNILTTPSEQTGGWGEGGEGTTVPDEF